VYHPHDGFHPGSSRASTHDLAEPGVEPSSSRPEEMPWRAALGEPHDFAALPVVDRDVKSGMRIHPLELRDRR
jgi:hypothetical protein